MMISTKGRYALRLMVDLAEHQQENYHTRSRRSPSARSCRKSTWRASSSCWYGITFWRASAARAAATV